MQASKVALISHAVSGYHGAGLHADPHFPCVILDLKELMSLEIARAVFVIEPLCHPIPCCALSTLAHDSPCAQLTMCACHLRARSVSHDP